MDVLSVVTFLIFFIGLSTAYETCYTKEVDWVKYDVTRDTRFRYRMSTSRTCYGTDYCCSGHCCMTYKNTNGQYNNHTYSEPSGGVIVGIMFGCIFGFSCLVIILRKICCGRVVTKRRTPVKRRANMVVIQTASSTIPNTTISNPVFTENSPLAYSEPPPSYSEVMAAGVVRKPPKEQTLPNTKVLQQQSAPSSNSRNLGSAGDQNEIKQQTV